MKLRYLAGYSAPLLALCRRLRSLLLNDDVGVVKVLIYHNISGDKFALFRRQIQYLASAYQFLTPLQFEEFVYGSYRISGINLLITFDDGFKSNRIVAEKILNPLGIKGIFFVPTEFIALQDTNKQNEFITQKIFDGDAHNPEILPDMQPLTWEDLECLLAQGHIIGSHSRNHKRLSSIHSQKDLYDEIIESGNILERKLRIPITHFAYPFGDIGSISRQAMKLIQERYTYCFSGIRGENRFPIVRHAILRDSISVDDTLYYTHLIVEKALDPIYWKKVKTLKTLISDRN